MLFLLDTNAVSDLMRESATMMARLTSITPGDRVETTVVVRGEILYGIHRLPEGRRKAELTSKAAAIFAGLDCQDMPATTAEHYADITAARNRSGLVLDENDVWIAATARCLGAVLVSRDQDFARIEGLTVENWES